MKPVSKTVVAELREIQIAVNKAMKDEGISPLALPPPVAEYIRLANLAMTVLEDAIGN
jgi:hypothetical protein